MLISIATWEPWLGHDLMSFHSINNIIESQVDVNNQIRFDLFCLHYSCFPSLSQRLNS